MTKGQRTRLKELYWAAVLQDRKDNPDAQPDVSRYTRLVFKLHHDEIVQEGLQLAEQQLNVIGRQLLKEGGKAPEGSRRAQMALPGHALPPTYSYVSDEGKLVRSYSEDMDEAKMIKSEEYLRKMGYSCIDNADDLAIKREYLQPGFDANPGCTVWEAYRYVNRKAA